MASTQSNNRKLLNDVLHAKRLERAISAAERSSLRTFMTGAVVYNDTQRHVANTPQALVAAGWSHRSELNLTRYPRSIHAELHAILRTPYKELLHGATIYIATIRRKSNNIGLARPCFACMDLLYEVGVKEAYFSVEGETWSMVDLTTLPKYDNMAGSTQKG